ncbi:bifunctional indole-3-glycerol-phosphate synthase TrpC/phosphoribosylanthranilate isomerase TrpF [Blochmannia endosymbiont of Camponotus (Colobopsis) obliquus]|uniref:bifunctional indole-3-glycerol-phosphate synthase TrpC/phosphoribosylanthranilate isomerase TrpF n=1 Tax=Blochmannia endosymbiont of Camponotus (Colobopsis) obliquus TaxID=1505597 RepID=UPI00061A69AA|nr:bifunctional indole-3-glycerol-phosphate synthase TrpC/phosphoribosylanthranilate isomerase TrpF [Blochmannia endosymbiont of Camponotus (Colobopsis) obliquus]AKC60582.1 tryptophan biosynthesis protein TrpCF [Blochmannia endosymbiont of Camponotus (Colobopsis) obliquus]
MKNNTLLKEIIKHKKSWISSKMEQFPLENIKKQSIPSVRNFYQELTKPQKIFILECKKASPTKGIIRKNFNLKNIANVYKHYASVISVLTDEKYFYGNFSFLTQISNMVKQPILCKDFIISSWQIFFARLHRADAILLMLSILNDHDYKKLATVAHNLNMGVLTEVINQEEWQRAITLKAKVIGINNRNLHDLSINLDRTIDLARQKIKETIVISESGIKKHQEILKLSKYVHGFLIGSTLMAATDLNITVRKLLFGENKVCGLTRIVDAQASYIAGAVYGGLIFIDKSPRRIDIFTAKTIISEIKSLLYIGVFCDAPISHIIKVTQILKLHAVQLHGKENQFYINQLRKKLPKYCQIWKVFNMNHKDTKVQYLNNINRYILDNGGGSGKTFNWELIDNNINIKKNNIILAGGLKEDNCITAIKLKCAGLDFNSGVEIRPGIKNHNKLKKIFQIIKNL